MGKGGQVNNTGKRDHLAWIGKWAVMVTYWVLISFIIAVIAQYLLGVHIEGGSGAALVYRIILSAAGAGHVCLLKWLE